MSVGSFFTGLGKDVGLTGPGGLFGGAGSMDPGLVHEFHAGKGGKPAGSGIDLASLLSALQGLGSGGVDPSLIPPPPEWIPMPPPSATMRDLRNAPRLAQRQLMPAPDWMQPYLWGVR
jgi:hypothetical protein